MADSTGEVVLWFVNNKGKSDGVSLASVLHKHLTDDPTGGTAYDALKRVSTESDAAVDRLIVWLTDSQNSEAAKKFAEGFLACVEKPGSASETLLRSPCVDLEAGAPGGADLAAGAPGGADLQAEEPIGSSEGPLVAAAPSSSLTTDATRTPTKDADSKFDFQLQKLDFNKADIRKEVEIVKGFYGSGPIRDLDVETVGKLIHLDGHAHNIYKEMKREGTLVFKQDPLPRNLKKSSKTIVCPELTDFWHKMRGSKQWKSDRLLITSQEWASIATASILYLYALRSMNKKK